jgi:hypothetical protein
MVKNFAVKQNADLAKEVPTEVLADSIVAVSAAIKQLRQSRLSEKTFLLLLSHSSGICQRDVQRVLDAAEALETQYLKPRRPKP